ncbi:hypothetical protein KAR91_82685 [Candidatus Pacearchaeota archaeon]|nr:hypothetical protein [Candidatus Pacearchaeota archaeon]
MIIMLELGTRKINPIGDSKMAALPAIWFKQFPHDVKEVDVQMDHDKRLIITAVEDET